MDNPPPSEAMEVMHDPLNLLRAHIAANAGPIGLLNKTRQPVDAVIKASYISLSLGTTAEGDDQTSAEHVVLPADTPTRFTTQLNDSHTTYTLAQLAYVFTSQGSSAAEYMKNASVGGVGVTVGMGIGTAGVPGGMENAFRPVTLIDRRVVLEYLLGGQAPAGRILVLGSKPDDQHFEGSLPIVHPDLQTLLHSTTNNQSNDSSTSSTLQGGALASQGSGKRKAYVVNAQDVEAVKKDFTTLRRAIMNERIKPLRDLLKAQKTGGPGASAGILSAGLHAGDRPKKQRAAQQNILLLSSSPTALITMWNVKRFLEDGVFEKSEQAKARQQAEGNRHLEDVIVIYRTILTPDGTERKIKYYAIESVDVLMKLTGGGPEAWDRVLCVFTTGQAWQFKGYRWTDPKDLFQHLRGVYFQFSNDQPHVSIKDWKVTTFKIDPYQRHTDKPTVGSFWAHLENVRR
ncbi:hypothetical protein QFC21_004843 [Naganishia friedmannii]|uniref:Uncharacterized protein n=1 Tax=Naganishia friedmannii TaxID=89922 RepID=A0ACC2VDE5_9TREE|nr:hypothetical protein QFC21_004843 [Naganishia friedmannii]